MNIKQLLEAMNLSKHADATAHDGSSSPPDAGKSWWTCHHWWCCKHKNSFSNHTEICTRILSCHSSDYQYNRYSQWRNDHCQRSHYNIPTRGLSLSHLEGRDQGWGSLSCICKQKFKVEGWQKRKKCGPKCYNCNKLGHKSADFYGPEGGKLLVNLRWWRRVEPCLHSLWAHHSTVLPLSYESLLNNEVPSLIVVCLTTTAQTNWNSRISHL